MNREILFRGFHADENGNYRIQIDGKIIRGEWVEGEPINKGRYIMTYSDTPGSVDRAHSLTMLPCVIHKVIPSTVSEYTGSSDKNGAKIFEGDICNVDSYTYKVSFEYAQWNYDIISDTVYCRPAFYSHCGEYCEIIGTIFDAEVQGG